MKKVLILVVILMSLTNAGCASVDTNTNAKKPKLLYEEAIETAQSELFYSDSIDLFIELKTIEGYEKYISEEECNKYINYLTSFYEARELVSDVIDAALKRKESFEGYTTYENEDIKTALNMLKDLKNEDNIEKYINVSQVNSFIELYEDMLTDDNESYTVDTYNQRDIKIGMTQKEILNSNWGKPKDINKTTTAYSVHEQWVYDGFKYLYFEDGILTTIQE